MSIYDDRKFEPAPEARKPIRIVSVDDNWLIIESLRAAVSAQPHLQWVGALPRGDDLVALAQRECPDIVLLDLTMPGRSAYEVMQELRHACPNVSVIMYTADASPETQERCAQLGARGFVSKFDSAQKLLGEIERVAKERSQHK